MPSQPLVFVMQRRPRAVVADDSHFMRNVITDILEDGGASTDDGATAAHDPGGSAHPLVDKTFFCGGCSLDKFHPERWLN